MLNLVWDKTVVPDSLGSGCHRQTGAANRGRHGVTGQKAGRFLFSGGDFYYNHDLDLKKALDWVNAGLADNPRIAYEMLHLKAQILAKQGDKAGAIAAAKQSTELAIKAEGASSSFVKMNQDLISSLQQ